MRFAIGKASSRDYEDTIELETFDQLLAFAHENGDLILYFSENDPDKLPRIIIYDDYVE